MTKVNSLIIVFDENNVIISPFISVGVEGPSSPKTSKIVNVYIKK